MKTIIMLVSMLATAAFSNAFAENTNNADSSCNAEISIRLKEPAKEIKTNEPVILLVQIKNLSTNETLIFRTENMPADFTWTITSPSGKNLSPKKQPFDAAISGWFPKLKPMETRESDYDLGAICDFSENGVYKVIVKKEVFRLAPVREKCEIISSPLHITISK